MNPPSRTALSRWLIGHTRDLLPALALSTVARIVGDLLSVAFLVVAVQGLVNRAPLAPLLVTLGLLGLAKATARYVEHYLGHRVAFSALHRLRTLLFEALIPQAPAVSLGASSAERAERATRDIDRIEVFFAHTLAPVISSVLAPTAALIWLATDQGGSVAAVIALPLATATALPLLGLTRAGGIARAELAARGRLATHIVDDVQGLREVMAFNAAEERRQRRHRIEADIATAVRRHAGLSALRHAVERLLWTGALVGIVVVAPTAEAAAVALATLLGLWMGAGGIDDFAAGLESAFAACHRVYHLIEATPAVVDTGDAAGDLPGCSPFAMNGVALEGVSFGYAAEAKVLSGVSLSVEPGSWHHLVGASGSGKSTIGALIARSYDPDAGQVRFDNIDATVLPLDRLRTAVKVVDQRPVFFPGTVADNLRLGAPDATDDDLAAALDRAALPVDSLSHGLTTAVGAQADGLSGGQLQRLALARALLTRPHVLVLDEALSQLDDATADQVRESLERLCDRPTIIEITHRVDRLTPAATVSVIDRGQVVAAGRVADLRDRPGPFAQLLSRSAG